jgi:hypothetical protein
MNVDKIPEEPEEYDKAKYICLFSEGIRNYNADEYKKLAVLLKKKNINLLVYNIAN